MLDNLQECRIRGMSGAAVFWQDWEAVISVEGAMYESGRVLCASPLNELLARLRRVRVGCAERQDQLTNHFGASPGTATGIAYIGSAPGRPGVRFAPVCPRSLPGRPPGAGIIAEKVLLDALVGAAVRRAGE